MATKKTVTKKKAASAKKTVKKTGAVKKTTAKKAVKTPTKKIAAKKPVVKKTPTKKTPAKAAVKKTVTQKTGAKKTVKKPVVKKPAGLPEQLLAAALKVLDERQAEEIVTVDLTGRSTVADYVVIASGRASRQIGAIAHYMARAFADLGVRNTRIEGAGEGNWVLVDVGDIIVHLFRPEVRAYYNLEQLWTKKGNGREAASPADGAVDATPDHEADADEDTDTDIA